jgi:polysaccharide chain length determinant protein (PEP-CTERM system associated)
VIPGREYTVAEWIAIAWRRKWQIVIPAIVVFAGTAVVARYLPDRYRSQSLIMVVPQRIPEEYVRATVTTRIEERLQSIQQTLLSRSTLERLIEEFDLYKQELKRAPMEEVVARMRANITISLVQKEAFLISYEADNPATAQRVTARLARLISEENARDRQGLASDTSDFLEEELRSAERRLAEQERALATYRTQNVGELPDQLPSIMQAIQTRQLQLQTLSEALSRDRSEQLLVERQRADLTAVSSLQLSALPAGNVTPDGAPAQVQLESARAELQRLLLSRTPNHPDIQVAERRVDVWAKRVKEEEEALIRKEKPKTMTAAEINRTNRLKELDAQKLNLDRQVAAREEMQKKLQQEIQSYQAKAEAVPLRESQLAALTRGYETLQQTYQGLLRKKEDSQIAANLERRRASEQFNILDPADYPARPYSPNRPRIVFLGLAAGLALGIALAALLEIRDTSLRSEADVAFALGLPVLATVPELLPARAEAGKHRVRRLVSVILAVAILGAGVAAVLLMER